MQSVRFIMEENKYFTPIFDVTINKYKDSKIILYYLAFINKNQDYINANKRNMSYLFSYITIHFTPGYTFAMIVEITLQDTYMINCLK